VVRKESPYTSPPKLIADAKANPGKLNCGVSAIASRVGCELLKKHAGIDFQIVVFKSGAAALNAVAGGVVDFVITDSGSAATAIQGGLLRAIGVTSAARVPLYPDVATFAETLPGFVYEGWAGLSAPAGTPKAIVEKMNTYLRQALDEPEFRKGIESRGGSILPMTASEQADWVAADRKRWKEWIKQVDLKME
jgi:tripartite-type tricarboxylate transporter receptor subunit TctC